MNKKSITHQGPPTYGLRTAPFKVACIFSKGHEATGKRSHGDTCHPWGCNSILGAARALVPPNRKVQQRYLSISLGRKARTMTALDVHFGGFHWIGRGKEPISTFLIRTNLSFTSCHVPTFFFPFSLLLLPSNCYCAASWSNLLGKQITTPRCHRAFRPTIPTSRPVAPEAPPPQATALVHSSLVQGRHRHTSWHEPSLLSLPST